MAITQISKSGMDTLWLARKQGSAIFRVANRRAGHSNLGTRPNVPFLMWGSAAPVCESRAIRKESFAYLWGKVVKP